jgi:DNA polymerase III subunit beta
MDEQEQGVGEFRLTLFELQRALAAVRHAVPKRPLLPELGGVLFEADPGERGVLVRATDMVNHVRLRVDAPIASGRRLVDFKQLAAKVAAIAKGKSKSLRQRLLVSIDGGNGREAFLTAGEVRDLKVACYSADDYPPLAAEAPLFAEVDAERFADAVQRIGPVASLERELERWCGLRLTRGERALELLASDQFRVALGIVPVSSWPEGVDGAGAAAPRADAIVKFAKLLEEGMVRIGAQPEDGGRVTLSTDDLRIVMRAVTGEPPRLPATPTVDPIRRKVHRERLLAQVERARWLLTAFGPAGKGVRLVLDADGARVLPVHRGRWDEVRAPVIEAEGEGEAYVVVDADRLAAGLKLLQGVHVALDLYPGRPKLPLTVREGDEGQDRDGFRYVLMPIPDESRSGCLEPAVAGRQPARFSSDAGPLREALELVGSGVPEALRGSRAAGVLLDGRDGELVLSTPAGASKGGVRASGSRAEGRLLLNHAELLGLVKGAVRDLDEWDAGAEPVEIVGAGSEAAVLQLREYALPVSGYAVNGQPPARAAGAAVGEVDTFDLRRAVRLVERSTGTRPDERQWYGVKLELRGGLLTFVSTDRGRVAVAPIELNGAPDALHREAVLSLDLLQRLADGARGARVQLGWRNGDPLPEISLVCGDATIVGESLTSEFVAHQREFERPVAGCGAAIRTELIDAVKEAIVLGKSVERQPLLDVAFGPEGVGFEPVGVHGGKVGGIQVRTRIEHLTEEHTARYVGAWLLDALESFDTSLVALHVGSEPGPLLLTRAKEKPSDPGAFRYLVRQRRAQR